MLVAFLLLFLGKVTFFDILDVKICVVILPAEHCISL